MQNLIRHLQQETGQNLENHRLTSVGGGDINTAYKLQAEGTCWFIKLNRADLQDMFASEAAGLQALANTGPVRVPEVIAFGRFQQHAYLILEHIELSSLYGPSLSRFGQQLAQLHQQQQAWFGWQRDNTIGSTPQYNTRHDDWVRFWRQERLGRQLQFAATNGYGGILQSRVKNCWKGLPVFSWIIYRKPRCYTAICGVVMPPPTGKAIRSCSIRPAIMAIGKPILP